MHRPTASLPDEFAGRRALVTGGSRGMGAAIAQRLIDGGAAVVTSARTATADTPKASTFIASDLRSEAGASQLAAQTLAALGGLDILINAAGASRVYMAGPAAIPDSEWQDSLDINFLSAVRLTNAVLPALQESGAGAAIVNISTGAAKAPQPPVLTRPAASRSCRPSPTPWACPVTPSQKTCRSGTSATPATSPRRRRTSSRSAPSGSPGRTSTSAAASSTPGLACGAP